MDALNTLHRAEWTKVADVCANYSTEIADEPDIETMIADWLPEIDAWDALQSQIAGSSSGGTAIQKNLYWETCATNVGRWGIRLHIQAHKDGLFTLEKLINKAKYELTSGRAMDAYNLMVAMKDGMKAEKSHFVVQKFTPLVITGLETDLFNFLGEINTPKQASNDKSALQKQADDLFVVIEAGMEDFVLLLESAFEITDPELVGALKLAHRVGKPVGHRFTGVEGVGKRASVPLHRYSVSSAAYPKKFAYIDLLGDYRIKGIKSGLDELILKDEAGLEVARQTVKFVKGNMLTVNWSI